jgi:hypothetical protein
VMVGYARRLAGETTSSFGGTAAPTALGLRG